MKTYHNKFDLNVVSTRQHELVRTTRKPQVVLPVQTRVPKKAILPFVAVLLVLTLTFQGLVYLSSARTAQGEILGAATSAYADLSSAGSSLKNQNFTDAQNLFGSALSNLQNAQAQLDEFKALSTVVPQAKSADHLLSGASLLANAGGRLSAALKIFEELQVNSGGLVGDDFISKLKQNRDSLVDTLELLRQAGGEFAAVTNVPGEYSETINTARQQVSLLTNTLENLVNLEDLFLGFFGDGMKTYLLVFQNPDEARATGGFLGTYGVLKVDQGKIQNLKIESIYNLDGRIYDRIAAPGPFQPLIQKWGIRDANWFVDFPQSSQKLLYFYELAGETADGVLALTPNVFLDLLKLTGPISMPAYGVTLTSENFQEVVQYETSVAYDRKLNQPKKMLTDFAPIMLDRLSNLDQEKWLEVMQIIQNNLNQKHVLLYSRNLELQQKVQHMRLSGEVLSTDHDYLNIVNTNLGGTKTDLKVQQKANLYSKILSDGTVINTLTINRLNTSLVENKNYIRILVPLGSTLLSAKGFDTGEFHTSTADGFKTDPDLALWDQGKQAGNVFVRTEAGKTEFAGWNITTPGQETMITLVYIIPYKANTNIWKDNVPYSLLLQKQSGTKAYEFQATIELGKLEPFWMSSDVAAENGKAYFKYSTNSDQYWAVLLSK